MFTVKRKKLAHLPTPLQYLSNLSKELGVEIFCKRDDLTGDIGIYGNKVRKLEYILPHAKEESASTLIVTGGVQSNMVRAACALAVRFGFKTEAVLTGMMPRKARANLFLDKLFAANLHYINEEDKEDYIAKLNENLLERGQKPYIIPLGASNGLGTLGYIDAYLEMRKQAKKKDYNFNWEFITLGSGGTSAGIAMGAALDKHSKKTKIVGVSVAQKEEVAQKRVLYCIDDAEQYIKNEYFKKMRMREFIVEENFIGAGYGLATTECLQAIKLLAKTEGIVLDHVYTAKTFAALCSYIKKNIIKQGEKILFWHTGGATGLLSKSFEELDFDVL